MNKIKFIKNRYLSNYIIVDILLVIFFYFIYIKLPYNYFEIPSFITSIYWFPLLFIFLNTEKNNKLKRSEKFKEIVIIYILYVFIFIWIIFILKNYSINISNLFLNIFISILTVTFLRLAVFWIFSLILWLRSKRK